MAVVLVTSDAFSERFDVHKTGMGSPSGAPETGGMKVRDLPAIYPKANRYASLFVETAGGKKIILAGENKKADPQSKETTSWTNFSLQQVKELRKEKVQVIQTFGEDYSFFFGETPRVMSFSGTLLNSQSHSWRAEFWNNYDKYFRGTQLVRNKARLYMIYDDILLQGYMLAAQATDNANLPHQIPFGFSMLITSYVNVQSMQDPSNALFSRETGKADLSEGFVLHDDAARTVLEGRKIFSPQLAQVKLNKDGRSTAQALYDLLTGDTARALLQAGLQGGPKALVGTAASMGFGAAANEVPALRHVEPLFSQGAQAFSNGQLQDATQRKKFFDPTKNETAAGAYTASAAAMGGFLVSSAGVAQAGDPRTPSTAERSEYSSSTGTDTVTRSSSGASIRSASPSGAEVGAGGRVRAVTDITEDPDGNVS